MSFIWGCFSSIKSLKLNIIRCANKIENTLIQQNSRLIVMPGLSKHPQLEPFDMSFDPAHDVLRATKLQLFA